MWSNIVVFDQGIFGLRNLFVVFHKCGIASHHRHHHHHHHFFIIINDIYRIANCLSENVLHPFGEVERFRVWKLAGKTMFSYPLRHLIAMLPWMMSTNIFFSRADVHILRKRFYIREELKELYWKTVESLWFCTHLNHRQHSVADLCTSTHFFSKEVYQNFSRKCLKKQWCA